MGNSRGEKKGLTRERKERERGRERERGLEMGNQLAIWKKKKK